MRDPAAELDVIRCVALRVIADLKCSWEHLRDGSHDDDMISEAYEVALRRVLPRYLPKTYGRTLADFAFKAIFGHLCDYATRTASDWHAGRDSRRDMLATFRCAADVYEEQIVDDATVDLEREEQRAAVRSRLVELADDVDDLAIALETEAMGATCGEVGRDIGVHHNTVAWRRDRVLDRLRADEELRDLYAERFGADSLSIDYSEAIGAEAICAWMCAVASWERPVRHSFRPRRRLHCPRPRRGTPPTPVTRCATRCAGQRERGPNPVAGGLRPVALWPSPRAGPAVPPGALAN